MPPERPDLPKEFAASARVHAADVAAALTLYAGVSLAAGRVFRFAFDDELLTRAVAERSHGFGDFILFFLGGGDVHPPLAFTVFYALARAGFADWALRLVSVSLTALSIGLFHLLGLAILRERTGAPVAPVSRLAAVLLFGLSPMAVSQGDAIRWYPPFAALIAVFAVATLVGRGAGGRLTGAVALGLAASTNFLAIFPAAALALYRYGLQRQFAWRSDALYWLIVGVLALPGLVTFWSLAAAGPSAIGHGALDAGVLRATATTVLGLAGGDAVGIGNAWIVAPLLVITPLALVASVNVRRADDPMHFLLLLLLALPAMTVAGFAEPRAYLFLMPVFALAILLLLNDGLARGRPRALLATAMTVAPMVGALVNVAGTTHPFKRNAVVPYEQVLAVIDANADGRVLVLSTDPVLAWTLGHEQARPERCVSLFFSRGACFDDPDRYQTIVVVGGHSNRSSPDFARRFAARLDGLVGGRRKVMSVPAGFDADAALKARLTGTPLGSAILTVDVYR